MKESLVNGLFVSGLGAPGFARLSEQRARVAKGPLRRRGGRLVARVGCPRWFDSCNDGKVVVRRSPKARGDRFLLARGGFELAGGELDKVRLRLTRCGKRWFRNHDGIRTMVRVATAERPNGARQRRAARGWGRGRKGPPARARRDRRVPEVGAAWRSLASALWRGYPRTASRPGRSTCTGTA